MKLKVKLKEDTSKKGKMCKIKEDASKEPRFLGFKL